MTDRAAKVTKFLAAALEDRLALVVAEAMGEEIENILEGEHGSAKEWEAMAKMLTSDDEASRHRQAKIRASGDYAKAKQAVRDWMRGLVRTHGGQI